MARIYDTGDKELTNAAGAVIPVNEHSEAAADTLDSITLNNYAAKLVKIIIEVTDATAATGTLNIFSEPNATWAQATPTQAPMNTTGHIAAIAVTTLGTIDDNTRYFANNEGTVTNKLWLSYYNSNADNCKVKVRILYETLGIG